MFLMREAVPHNVSDVQVHNMSGVLRALSHFTKTSMPCGLA